MENPTHFLTRFSSLRANDFTPLADFNHFSFNESHLFLTGNIHSQNPDTILSEYLRSGNKALTSLDGEFLVIIVHDNKVMFFRDRHGAGTRLFFSDEYCSSSLNDFTSLQNFACKPDIESLFTFLSIGYIPSPATSLSGVRKLAGGSLLTFSGNGFITTDLFDFNDFAGSAGKTALSLDEATIEYERLHKKSIADRVANKENVGLLLSGGYDSGGNISALRDLYGGKVVSYSIGFKDNPWTELPLARVLSDRYQSQHYEYEIDGSEIMDLPVIIGNVGDPFQEGGLMVNYTAMRLVKESGEMPGVILGGDGNDQHFGTSGKELALHWKFKKNGIGIFQKLLDTAGNNSLFEKDNLLFRAEFHNRKILHIQQSDNFGFTPQYLNKINSIGYKVPDYAYLKSSPTSYDNFSFFYYCRNYFIDIKQVINEVILFKASGMADLFSNNISFPYMSTDLYNFLKQMPVEYKFYGTVSEMSKGEGKSKFLHKRYLKPKLPTEITERKKQGGFAPLPIFLKNKEQREAIFSVIRKSGAVDALFNKEKINEILDQYNLIADSPGYWFWFRQVKANQIINLLTLAVWWEMNINGKNQIKSVYDLM
jgi:asparagine synthase (glutamine-hydrolysing)